MAQSRIALDVMGGDHAPKATLEGALLAVSPKAKHRIPAERLVLVGDQAAIDDGLKTLGGNPGFHVVHASQVIGMGESPATALRSKPDSSIGVCIGLCKKGEVGAAVSMGNTGAMVGAATLFLGTLTGVKRPGIAVSIDLGGHPLTLIDMGANVAPKPEHLVQYGLMGAVYASNVLALPNPRVGLLNIGEEEGKGNDLMKETYGLFKSSGQNFVGNVEGHDIFRRACEVVVTDGFTGNVVLKLLEGFSGFLLQLVLAELKSHGAAWAGEALQHVKKSIDYAEYGGALLLGVQGTIVIGHGRSDATAVANALGLGARAMDAQVNESIVAGVARVGAQA